jgi:hypothetical protein
VKEAQSFISLSCRFVMADAPLEATPNGPTDDTNVAKPELPPSVVPAPSSSPKSSFYTRLPIELRSYATKADCTIARLNKLKTPTKHSPF